MASASAQATKNEITLKGSVEIVTEFFGYVRSRARSPAPPKSQATRARHVACTARSGGARPRARFASLSAS